MISSFENETWTPSADRDNGNAGAGITEFQFYAPACFARQHNELLAQDRVFRLRRRP
jgi:hypothetical protein